MALRRQLDQGDMFRPSVRELLPAPDPVDVFRQLVKLPHCLFLDSVLQDPHLGRYSFVAADPFDVMIVPSHGTTQLTDLQQRMAPWQSLGLDELPPFQGGAAGLFGYDLNRSFERLPAPRTDEFQVPQLAIGFYDVVVAFDHVERRAWLVSQGLPELTADARRSRAELRLERFAQLLSAPLSQSPPCPDAPAASAKSLSEHLPLSALSAQYATHLDPELTSNFTPSGYRRAIAEAIEYIRAGDIFQVNLSQRLLFPAHNDPLALYLRLRERNAATFAGYFDIGPFQLLSASPERFLSLRQRHVETRPIKGTRPRCQRPEADLFSAGDLRASVKDRAENVMIVDLLRNDLSRVCSPDSICVRELCRLESYEFVQHLVSVVTGTLDESSSPFDVIRAAFPGGSITGAPKVRAMEIIQELEPTARGPYCGSLGYVGFDGSMDLSILIRTITAGRGWWQFPVGGGIVAQSEPDREYEETWQKAVGMVRALRP